MTNTEKFEELLEANGKGGRIAEKIESFVKKLQPEARDMFDLTEENINKIYNAVSDEMQKENMKEFTVTLTAKDIEALQIALSAEKLNLESEARHLEEHNKTGINTNKINQKRDRMNDCDRLFDILYNAMD